MVALPRDLGHPEPVAQVMSITIDLSADYVKEGFIRLGKPF
jgi:hypothetical protein